MIALVVCSVAFIFEFKIFCIKGIANAAVFPDPVRALSKTSFPSNNKGIAFSCINVGDNHPSRAIAYKI